MVMDPKIVKDETDLWFITDSLNTTTKFSLCLLCHPHFV